MERDDGVPRWFSGVVGLGALAALLWLEHRRALRTPVESTSRRQARNVGVAAVSAAVLQIADRPITRPLSALVQRRRWGLLQQLRLPRWLETILAIVLLDYTLYIWHVLTHRMPLLWRFHFVHHADLDMDATTALRFHFGELAASVPWRAGQIMLIGVSPRALSVWQTGLFTSILFHHSNVRLPQKLERRLGWLVVTPRMHGIHHSTDPHRMNANWSSGLTVWDRLHGTLRLDEADPGSGIGVAGYRDPRALTLPKLLAFPFTRQQSRLPALASRPADS